MRTKETGIVSIADRSLQKLHKRDMNRIDEGDVTHESETEDIAGNSIQQN